jgi:hypothetical protein
VVSGSTDLPSSVTEQLIQNQLSDWETAVSEISVQFRLGIPGASRRIWQELEDHQTKK